MGYFSMLYQKKIWNLRSEKSGRQQLLSTVVSHAINLQYTYTPNNMLGLPSL